MPNFNMTNTGYERSKQLALGSSPAGVVASKVGATLVPADINTATMGAGCLGGPAYDLRQYLRQKFGSDGVVAGRFVNDLLKIGANNTVIKGIATGTTNVVNDLAVPNVTVARQGFATLVESYAGDTWAVMRAVQHARGLGIPSSSV